jgi:hypothetical protein
MESLVSRIRAWTARAAGLTPTMAQDVRTGRPAQRDPRRNEASREGRGGSGGVPVTQHAEVDGQNNIIVQVVGDGNTIMPRYAHLTLTRYLTRRHRLTSEADLLSPYTMSIPMVGRAAQVAECHHWLTSDPPISIRVLVGRAGSGKTRLGLELCEAMRADHWDAGFVTDRELVRFLQQQNLSTWGWQRPTLMVVDAAATRARLLHDWLVELADHAGEPQRPLRLLLLGVTGGTLR